MMPCSSDIIDLEKIEDNGLVESTWLSLNLHGKKAVILLTTGDKEDLLQERNLNDNHINFVQTLLKAQFPVADGLLPMLQHCGMKDTNTPGNKIHHGLRVVHCRNNHWALVSTMNCEENEMKIFDSLYDSVDESTLDLIQKRFLFNSTVVVKVISAQKQSNSTNCGLFAIANATAILFNKNPETIHFHEKELKNHLCKCYEDNVLSPFPSSAKVT